MTTTMQLIAKQTVGSGGASSVTFSNIPQTYTDLKVVVSARSNVDSSPSNYGQLLAISLNSSSANFTRKFLYGTGSAAGSIGVSDNYIGYQNPSDYTANTFGNGEIYIPNYTSSTNKSISIDSVNENNATGADMGLVASLWSATPAAITSITLAPYSGSWVQYSTFYLYGISNSTTTQATAVPYASGGDVITTDGTYWYHAFKYSGSFTPLKNLTADVLVVAGGGAGGSEIGGGGGAGGLLGFTAQALTSATNYTCTVGAGAPQSSSTSNGSNGSDSQFGALTLVKGGGGGGYYSQNGLTGGSGGGGGRTGTGGSATTSQGYAGGAGSNTTGGGFGGGGGGASAVGQAAPSAAGGAGGAGSSTYSSWGSATATGENVSSTYYYAGGGGGGGESSGAAGAGGNGGGGAGGYGSPATGTAGTANTGGGGGAGGGTTSSKGGAGGSGIIIVRYAV